MIRPRDTAVVGVSLGAFLLVIGLLAFVTGLAQFFKLAIEDTSGKDRPVITAELAETDGGLFLTASVKASSLRSDEHVEVLVQGLNSRTELSDVVSGAGPRQRDDVPNYRDPSTEFDSPQQLHLSRVGGNRDGEVEASLKLPISIGLYERVRILAAVTRMGEDEDDDQRRRDQEEKNNKEATLDEAKETFQRESNTAALSVLAHAQRSEGGGLVEAAKDLLAESTSDDAEPSEAVEDPALSEEGASQRWNIAVDAALGSAHEQRFQSFANSLNDILQSAEELKDGARDELAYLQCLAQVELPAATDDGTTCAESIPSQTNSECLVSEEAGDDVVIRLTELSENGCIPEPAIVDRAIGWMTALEDFRSRGDLQLAHENSDDRTMEELQPLVEAVETAGRIRELDESLTVSFEEDLKEAQGCNEEILTTGCVTLLLPETQLRPSVGVSIAGDATVRAVDVKVRAEEIADGDSVSLVVAAGTGAADAVPVATTVIGSNGTGSADETFRIPLDPGHTYVCALSSIQRSSLRPTRSIMEMTEVRIDPLPGGSSPDNPTGAADPPDSDDGRICVSPPPTSGFTEVVVPLTAQG